MRDGTPCRSEEDALEMRWYTWYAYTLFQRSKNTRIVKSINVEIQSLLSRSDVDISAVANGVTIANAPIAVSASIAGSASIADNVPIANASTDDGISDTTGSVGSNDTTGSVGSNDSEVLDEEHRLEDQFSYESDEIGSVPLTRNRDGRFASTVRSRSAGDVNTQPRKRRKSFLGQTCVRRHKLKQSRKTQYLKTKIHAYRNWVTTIGEPSLTRLTTLIVRNRYDKALVSSNGENFGDEKLTMSAIFRLGKQMRSVKDTLVQVNSMRMLIADYMENNHRSRSVQEVRKEWEAIARRPESPFKLDERIFKEVSKDHGISAKLLKTWYHHFIKYNGFLPSGIGRKSEAFIDKNEDIKLMLTNWMRAHQKDMTMDRVRSYCD